MNRKFGLCGVIALLFSSVSITADAGSNSARLACKSSSQKAPLIEFKGTVPADHIDINVRVSAGAKSHELNNENSDAYFIENLKRGVYTLIIIDRERKAQTELYAIPATVKAKPVQADKDYTFEAIMTTLRPGSQEGNTYDAYLRNVRLSCVYHYEV
jgi:hypothetical protein